MQAQVSASGVEVPDSKAFAIENVNDGKTDTRWSSNTSDDAWVQLKLEHPVHLHHVNIYWERACAKAYHFEISADGKNWQKLPTKNPECGTLDQTIMPSEIAEQEFSYVKMQAEERTPVDGAKWGVSLYEMELWDGPEPQTIHILPRPLQVVMGGEKFIFTPNTYVVAAGEAKSVAELWAKDLRKSTGLPLQVRDSAAGVDTASGSNDAVAGAGAVVFKLDKSLTISGVTKNLDESYTLVSTPQQVVLTARTTRGLLWAARSLTQLLPAAAFSRQAVVANWEIPTVDISDAPRYAHRALQLDVARSFLSVEEVKRVIETASAVKMSVIHIHLADDQGWRIEITNEGREPGDTIDYTQLTARSGKTAMKTHSGAKRQTGLTELSTELGHTGFYTQAEYKELVAYAAQRGITLVPEIDMPGHTNAALYAIPQLNSAGSHHDGTKDAGGHPITDPAAWRTAPENNTGNVGYSYLDPDSQWTKYFVKHVLGQVAAMTPGKGALLHIGGDESHDMHKRYGQEKLNEFLKFTVGAVRELGKTPIGWNEISANDMREGEAVQYWTGGTENTVKAANSGATVVISKADSAYLDMHYPTNKILGLNWAGIGDADKYYNWDPDTIIPGLPAKQIRGVEGPQWSETLRGGSQVEFILFPRAVSHAALGWESKENHNLKVFLDSLAQLGPRLVFAESNFYDGPVEKWDKASAGRQLEAKPGEKAKLHVGRIAAPSTILENATTVQKDEKNGRSNTVIAQPLTAKIDFGDATAAVDAQFAPHVVRTDVSAAGVYEIFAEHTYAKSGEYQGTITFSDNTVEKFMVTVADDKKVDNSGLPQPPAEVTLNPQISIEKDKIFADDRVLVKLTGFQPNSFADLYWGVFPQFAVHIDAEGKAEFYMPFTQNMISGTKKVLAKQAGAQAQVEATLNGGREELHNPLALTYCQKVTANSEETQMEQPPNGPASAVCDGKKETFWHTKYSGGEDFPPHWLTIELSEPKKITGFEVTPRQTGNNGIWREFKVYVSADGQQWGDPVYTGIAPNSNEPQVVNLPADKYKDGRFVKFEVLNNHQNNAFASAAEIHLGAVEPSPDVKPPTPQPTPDPSPVPTPDPKPDPKPEPSPAPHPEPSMPTPQPSPDPTPNPDPSPVPEPAPNPNPVEMKWVRYAGLDRQATSLAAWKAMAEHTGVSAGADLAVGKTMLLTGYETQVDALAGGALSKVVHSSVVFNHAKQLDPAVKETLRTYGVKRVILLGGSQTISAAVENELRSIGLEVFRLAGQDRYETAVAIAEYYVKAQALSGKAVPVVLADGHDYADALVAGPVAAKLKGVVLLTHKDKIPASTASFLGKQSGSIISLGGAATRALATDMSLMPRVEASLVGADRYATAAQAVNRYFADASLVGLASGEQAADACAAGSVMAILGGGVLLSTADGVPIVTQQTLAKYSQVLLVGGEKILPTPRSFQAAR